MRNLIIFVIIIFITISCNKKFKGSNSTINIKTIKIPENFDDPFQIDSLISDIKLVPLQTDSNCLIGSTTSLANYNDNFYLFDRRNHALFVFNSNGKFLFKIDKKGKGEGEYIDIRDFKVDSAGYIYILDFKKILKYSPTGSFVSTINFWKLKNKEKNENINPLEFVLGNNNEIYFWNGSMGIHKSLKGQYAIYKINSDLKIVDRYLPIRREIFSMENTFYQYNSNYNIQPIHGNDTIYSVGSKGFYPSYYIDFGNWKLDNNILPVAGRGLSKFLFENDITNKYCTSISNFIETKDFITFNFWYKKNNHIAYYSKKDKKVIAGREYYFKKIRPTTFHCSYKDYFVSIMEVNTLKILINLLTHEDIKKLSKSDRLLVEMVKNLNVLNNPVLVFIKYKEN